MRIGLVTGEYPPMEGGVGAFTREIARAMQWHGHEVSVFTREHAHVNLTDHVDVNSVVTGTWGWQTNRAIVRWALTGQFDVLNIQFQTAAFNMHPAIHWLPNNLRRASLRSVVTCHDLRVPYLFPKAGRIRGWVVRKLARDADGVIATDPSDAGRLKDEWKLRSVRWIPIGSNVSAHLPEGFDRDRYRSGMSIESNQLLVSYFGFLNKSKGCLILVDALAEIVQEGIDAHLVMIGGRAGASDLTNHAFAETLDRRIAEQGLNGRIQWSGFVDDSAVSALFAASDITALPYLDGVSFRRGSLMAALAHGKAIVTTLPVGDVSDLCASVEMVPANDSAALAARIIEVWLDARRRTALEQAALSTSRRFSWDAIATRTVDFFAEILAYGRR